MKDADVIVKNDMTNNVNQAMATLEQHQDDLAAEKLTEPQRFIPAAASANRGHGHLRVAPRKVAQNEFSGPSVQFKKVQVKQLDESVAQLRAAHSLSTGRAGEGSSNKSMMSQQSNNMTSTAVPQQYSNIKPSMDLLNACVVGNLDAATVSSFDPRKDAVVCFVESLAALDDKTASNVFATISKRLGGAIAENCLASPKEFWTFFNLCWTATTLVKANTKVFRCVISLLETIGAQMVERDPYVPLALFFDFGIPKMFDALKRDANKLPELTKLVFAFSVKDADEHVKVIRVLREGLKDFPTMVRCLNVLISMETNFSPQSLDLYLYFICSGLKHSSPSVRSTCVHMLASVATADDCQGYKHVVNLLDQLEAMAKDTWEVQCAVLHTYCALLSALPPRDPLCKQLYQMVEQLINQKGSPLVARAGLVYLSQCISQHFTLKDVFMDILTNSPEIANPVLGLSDDNKNPWKDQPKLSDVMDRVAIATMVSEHSNKNSNLDNLPPHMVKLVALSLQGITKFPAAEVSHWTGIFESLINHLLVEFTDPTFCEDISQIFYTFLMDPSTQDLARAKLFQTDENEGNDVSPLCGVLKLLFAGEEAGDSTCQKSIVMFLTRLVKESKSEVGDSVAKLLESFAELHRDQFKGSMLEKLSVLVKNEMAKP